MDGRIGGYGPFGRRDGDACIKWLTLRRGVLY